MFSGIIQEIGIVNRITKGAGLMKLAVTSPNIYKDVSVSDSISINGVCLTVTAKEKNTFCFDVMQSTLAHSTLTRLRKGDQVNCETALKVGDKLGGHFVLGHVDGQLRLRRIIKKTGCWQLEIVLPSRYRAGVIENGSIAIDGVSLTVKNVYTAVFTVDVIPFTFKHTTLQYRRAGDWLNVEFDYLRKKK
jgi:riboflavin synthase